MAKVEANNNGESLLLDQNENTMETSPRERQDDAKDESLQALVTVYCSSPLENLKMVKKGVNLRVKAGDTKLGVMHFAATNRQWSSELVAMFSLFGHDPFEPDASGATPIDYAIYARRMETAEQLLKMHNAGCNLLHYCIVRDRPKFLAQVLKYNAEKNKNMLNQYDFKGRNAFHVAAQFADETFFVIFLHEIRVRLSVEAYEKYFKSVCRDRGCSALHYAVLNKNKNAVEIIYQLYDIGLDEDQKNKKGYTPFHLAMITESLDVADALMYCDASTNEKVRGKSIMAVCVVLKKFKSVKYLHEMNDDNRIFRVRVEGYNAFHYALHTVDLETCKWLAEEVGFLKFELLRNNFPKGSRGNALHFSACNVNHGADLTKYFVEKGVDLNLEDKDGITPLHAAIIFNDPAVMEILIRAGADLEATYRGENYFFVSIRQRAPAAVKVMLKERKDLMQSYSINGESPLHVAAKCSTEEIARMLIEEGADLHAKTKDGKSVKDLIPKNYDTMIECFSEAFAAQCNIGNS